MRPRTPGLSEQKKHLLIVTNANRQTDLSMRRLADRQSDDKNPMISQLTFQVKTSHQLHWQEDYIQLNATRIMSLSFQIIS